MTNDTKKQRFTHPALAEMAKETNALRTVLRALQHLDTDTAARVLDRAAEALIPRPSNDAAPRDTP